MKKVNDDKEKGKKMMTNVEKKNKEYHLIGLIRKKIVTVFLGLQPIVPWSN